MAFELKGMAKNDFQYLNDFFSGKPIHPGFVEHSGKFLHPNAEVHLNEWYFEGIRMAHSNIRYKKPIDLEWYYEINPELVTFQANIHGSLFIGNRNNPYQLFGNYQHNLFSAGEGNASAGYLRPDNLLSSLLIIQFTKEAFLQLTHNTNSTLQKFNENVMAGNSSALSMKNLPVHSTMLNMVHNIMNCGYEGGLKRMYLLSKSIEFLVLQAEESERAQNPTYDYVKSKYDEECIFYAREYVLRHLENPPSLSELAKIIGLNEYKLKRGFKEIFGNTVFGYIADARLDKAKIYLLENCRNVSEISSDLGYSSVSHFSHAFKKKFGMPPTRLHKIMALKGTLKS